MRSNPEFDPEFFSGKAEHPGKRLKAPRRAIRYRKRSPYVVNRKEVPRNPLTVLTRPFSAALKRWYEICPDDRRVLVQYGIFVGFQVADVFTTYVGINTDNL